MFGKHFCTGGQGGMVYTRNNDRYWKVRRAADRGKPFGLPEGATNSIASLNFNLDELGAAIGRAQLRKLPGVLRKRRKIVARLREKFKGLRAVSMPPVPPETEPSYWFLRMRFHPDAVSCDKKTFCRTLAAEGILVNPEYQAMPHAYDWYKNRSVFGTSGYPWRSPLYRGNPNRRFPCPNALAAIRNHFNLVIAESWGDGEIGDIVKAVSYTHLTLPTIYSV